MMSPEEYAMAHKKAFRIAFDFLNAHFPPESGTEWWMKTASDASQASAGGGYDKLTDGLLAGILEYLESEEKRRTENGTAED